jgi:hypothetical protein
MYEKKWFWVVVIVLVVLVAVVVTASLTKKSAAPPGAVVFAPAGQLVSGFPEALLLNAGVPISQSYLVNGPSGPKQYTAVWDASSSGAMIYNAYLSYFENNGWTIANRTTQPKLLGLYAMQDSAAANVAISAQGTGAEAVVSYLPISPPIAGSAAIPAPPNLKTYSGKLNPAMPAQFVLASDAAILGSTDNPDQASHVETAGVLYSTKEPFDSLFTAYTNLLSQNGWKILVQAKGAGSTPQIVGENASSGIMLNVTFQTAAEPIVVSVSLTKPLPN